GLREPFRLKAATARRLSETRRGSPTGRRSAAFQRRTVPSVPALRMIRPPGANVAASTQPGWATRGPAIRWPDAASNIAIVPSSDPATIRRPSGEKPSDVASAKEPLDHRTRPLGTSSSASPDPEYAATASIRPFGLNALVAVDSISMGPAMRANVLASTR